MSRSLLLLFVTVLLLAVALPLLAQETADIAVGGGLVARLRDRGSFASVRDRAASIDKTLCDVISNKDTLHPMVTVKPKGKLWTVYAWEIAVMSVYPAEAKVNGLSEKKLAENWADNLRVRLPKATPCSKLPPEMLGYKPAKPGTAVAAKPTAAQPPVKTVTAKPAAAAKPVAAKPAAAKPVMVAIKPVATTPAKPASTMTGNETGAMLLIVDALRTARDMNDQDWAAGKETMAKNLYSDLSYYLTGKGAAPKLPVATAPKKATVVAKPAVIKPVAAKPVAKPATKPVVAAKPAAPAKPVVAATKPVAKPVVAAAKPVAKPAAKPVVASTKPADVSMAKVPQKNRIREKFAAAKEPYDKLAATDPQAAAQVSAMLAASRQSFAYGNFDDAEKQVDEALAALGVAPKAQ